MPNGPTTLTLHSMADVWDVYRGELDGVEEQIRKNLDSSVALVNTVAAHILNSGGKRIRPLFVLLSAHLCGYAGRDHQVLGSLVEFIHTATLLHDDVVDDADLRRGRRTAGKVWGNQISILVGDYLYSRAICQIVDFRNQGINEALSEACRKMAEGEVLQLYYNGNPLMPEPISPHHRAQDGRAHRGSLQDRRDRGWGNGRVTGGAVPVRAAPGHCISTGG